METPLSALLCRSTTHHGLCNIFRAITALDAFHIRQFLYGAVGRIRTFARLSPPNSLANCPLQPLEYYRIMAGHIGLEPIALRLTAECSTIELMSHFQKKIKSPFYFTFNHNMLWLALHIDTIYSGLDTKYGKIKSISCVFVIYCTIYSGEMAWDTTYSGIPSFSQNQQPSLEGGADGGTQTHSPLITNQLRYQLRHASVLMVFLTSTRTP